MYYQPEENRWFVALVSQGGSRLVCALGTLPLQFATRKAARGPRACRAACMSAEQGVA